MDDKVIISCKQNDAEAWRKLYAEGFRLARWVAMKKLFKCEESVYEDIAQETMIAISKILPTIKDDCHCERLIRRIARNKAIDHIRRHPAELVEYFEDKDYPEDDFTDEVLSSDSRSLGSAPQNIERPKNPEIEESVILALRRAMSKLGYPCKPILRRFYLDQAKHKEIAEEMGFPVNQMGMRISRCLKNLRTLFSVEGIQSEDVL